MHAKYTLLLAPVLAMLTLSPRAEPPSYRAEAAAFTREMVERHGFDPAWLQGLIEQASYRQAIVDAMDRPFEAKPWHAYRSLFLTPERIEAGTLFWRANAELLGRAESTYGVSPGIMVAIIGVETNYGANLGTYRVMDALTTLGFAYPRRSAFFRSELEAFLLLSREEAIDPLTAVGSYAGAMGKPQFIASSYRTYAVDFDGDGRRDLWGSNADVIGSVAHYLRRHGWQPGAPVAMRARPRAEIPDHIPIAEKQPRAPETTLAELSAAGLEWSDPLAPLAPTTPAILMRLDGDTDEYWIGLQNFHAITRYNLSNLYALAVHELSEAIASRVTASDGAAP
ncbi:MAG: lytic murein transglycosylase B [Sphingobacteriia bacterium]|nr:lytic murein transglycosylase B [Sphingobacteriia bacterium]NCC38121.1 lytic murein transglycosylase B [Gammaproteobacteria bacterium]